MKRILLGSSLCLLPSLTSAYVHVEAATSSEVRVADIQPFAKPFTHVPKYVFANPPYFERTWTDESFAARRKAATDATKEGIRKLVKQHTKDIDAAALDAKCLEAGEGYDWMHGMNYINDNLHKGAIDIRFVINLNMRLGRLTIANSGARRLRSTEWHRSQFDATENIFFEYISRTAEFCEFFRKLGRAHTRPFCETAYGIMNNEDRYLRVVDIRYISTQSIKDLLAALNSPDNLLLDRATRQPLQVNVHAAEAWESEEREANPAHREGYIDSGFWIYKRIYAFCEPEEILPNLAQALNDLTTSSLHPIEKAARIWLNIVRIHPFNGAHKRTGKALASRILLEAGYLPPVLTRKDVDEYTSVLMNSLDPENGYELFTQFVARKVMRTQEKYAGQTL